MRLIAVVLVSQSLENICPTLDNCDFSEICIVTSNQEASFFHAMGHATSKPVHYFLNVAETIAYLRNKHYNPSLVEEKENQNATWIVLLEEHSKFIWNQTDFSLLNELTQDTVVKCPRIFTSNGWITYEPRILPLFGWKLLSSYPKFIIETKLSKSNVVYKREGYAFNKPTKTMQGSKLLSYIHDIPNISNQKLAFLFALVDKNQEAIMTLEKVHGTKFWQKDPTPDQRNCGKHRFWKAYQLAGKLMPEQSTGELTRSNQILAYRNAFAIKNRCETASCLATLCRLSEHRREAWLWSIEGLRLRYYSQTPQYSYNYRDASEQLDENLGILAFYENHGDLKPGFEAIERLRFCPLTRPEQRTWAQNSTPYYLNPVEFGRVIQIADQTSFTLLQGVDNIFYVPNNPSIIKPSNAIKEKYKLPENIHYIVNVRFVSYVIHENGGYSTRTPDGVVHTRNMLFFMTESFEREAEIEIRDVASRPRFKRSVVGLEDPKLFEYNNYLWFSCTTPDTNVINESQDISLVQIDFDFEAKEGQSIAVHVLTKPDKTRVEKNWRPYVTSQGIRWLYLAQPITTCGFDEKIKDTFDWKRKTSSHFDLGSLRGSCCLQSWTYKNKPVRLGIDHEVCLHHIRGRLRRCYTHRFIAWNEDVNDIVAMSHVFYIQEQGIEFANGVCVDNDKIIVSFGMKDQTANLIVYPKHEIEDMLKPIDEFRSPPAEFVA